MINNLQWAFESIIEVHVSHKEVCSSVEAGRGLFSCRFLFLPSSLISTTTHYKLQQSSIAPNCYSI